MNNLKINYIFILCLFLFIEIPYTTLAQFSGDSFKTDYHINPENKKSLFFEIDNLNFFKDNEYSTPFTKGYTLPGFWATLKATYYPLSNIKLEGGIYGIRYWGANKYPNMAYQDIAKWKGDQYLKGFHILPWLRAQVGVSDAVNFVFGDIYGGSNHDLILPLYDPELNFTADPEMGVQFLLDTKRVKLDVWVNWESFIYRNDLHQEAFTIGASSRFNWNDPSSIVHWYSPLQILAQHRGGEIDTIYTSSVQTIMNAAIGIGAKWNLNHKYLKSLNFEIDGTGYYQQAGHLWGIDWGNGIYGKAEMEVSDFKFLAGYWWCYDFISMFGSPFFGVMSTSTPGMWFSHPSMINLGAEYSHTFAKGYTLGASAQVYQQFRTHSHDVDTNVKIVKPKTSFSGSIFLRVEPSFLLKKFIDK